jgi:hypothetical protein
MHTILRTGPVIASGLDDQRFALGDWRNGPPSAMVRPRHARDEECRSTTCPRLLCSAAHRIRLKAKRSTAHRNEARPMAVLNKLMARGIVPRRSRGPGLPARGDHHAGPIVIDFDSTAATVIAVAFGAGAAVLAVGSAPRQQASVRHIMRPADLAPIWSRMPRRRCCAGPAPRRSSPTCGVTSSGRRMVARPQSSQPPRGTGGNCGRQRWLRKACVGRGSLRPHAFRAGEHRWSRPARAAPGRGALGGHRGATSSHVVQEAGGLVAGAREDGFGDKQRHGRAP